VTTPGVRPCSISTESPTWTSVPSAYVNMTAHPSSAALANTSLHVGPVNPRSVSGRLFLYGSVRNPAVPRNAQSRCPDSGPSTGKNDPKRPAVLQRSGRSMGIDRDD
jgi:hypothetical protein